AVSARALGSSVSSAKLSHGARGSSGAGRLAGAARLAKPLPSVEGLAAIPGAATATPLWLDSGLGREGVALRASVPPPEPRVPAPPAGPEFVLRVSGIAPVGVGLGEAVWLLSPGAAPSAARLSRGISPSGGGAIGCSVHGVNASATASGV